jgi:CheY-like chemotaxis protein
MSAKVSNPKKPLALLVEDYSDAREMLRFLLQGLDLEVLETPDGSEAFRLARIYRPTLIITDLNLPGMDGIELVKKLRQSGNWLAVVPIIMLTAIDAESSQQSAISAGVNRFLTKPVNFKVLESAITELIEEARLREGNRQSNNAVT